MGLRDLVKRSAKALIGEVVDRVDRALERREHGGAPAPRWEPPPRPAPAPRTEPAREAEPRADAASDAASASEPVTAPDPVTTSEPATASEPVTAPEAVTAPDPASEAVTAPELTSEEARRELAREATPPPDEPILTRTMAGVLAAQGYHERALRIYDHLLGADPADSDLAAEAEAVRARMRDGEERPEDEVAAVPTRGGALLVSWEVTDRSVERARRVLGGDGALTARVVVVARDGGSQVRSDTLEHAPIELTGEHVFDAIPAGARCTASVGLRAADRFVSVAHSRVVPT